MSNYRQIPLEQIQDDFIGVLYSLQKDTEGFQKLSTLLKSLAGINLPLNDKNLSLMAGRLISIMRKYDFRSYDQYLTELYRNEPDMIFEFISRLTTNTTEFFREDSHFVYMKANLNRIMAKKIGPDKDELRIWCAACSSGQEAYSIAITALEAMPVDKKWKIKMLATDIDVEVLNRAMEGIYSAEETKTISLFIKNKYFTTTPGKREKVYCVNEQVKSLIQFASFNLITPNYPFKFPFDIVFCRNVFIYFDRDTQASITAKLAKSLRPGGLLFLGHSESGMVKSTLMKAISHAVYEKV